MSKDTKKTIQDIEDHTCDLDSMKECDNCMKCIMGEADFCSIVISGIELEDDETDKDKD